MRFEDVKEEAAAGPREVERRMVLRVPVESMMIELLFVGDDYLLFVVSFAKIMRGCERGGWIGINDLRWHVSDAKGFCKGSHRCDDGAIF